MSTSTPHGAREHARAQAGTKVEVMPTIPATTAIDLPTGVAASDVVWDEVIGAGSYSSKIVRRGTVLRLTDLHGDACAAVLLHNADQPSERLNVADTIKVQWQAYLGLGSLLLSDMGRALATIVDDTSGRHDTFCGVSNRTHNARRYGIGDVHAAAPNGRDRFVVALTKHGLTRRDVAPNITMFKGVTAHDDGSLALDPTPAAAGTHVELRAEMHLIVTVVNVPHVLDGRTDYTCTPLRLTAWSGEPIAAEDPQRFSSPEATRAYDNTDWYYAGKKAAAW